MVNHPHPHGKPTHSWLRPIRLGFVPGPSNPLLDRFIRGLLDTFAAHGHTVLEPPSEACDIVLTTARFGEPIPWKEGLFFTARRRFKLAAAPTVFTAIPATPGQFQDLLDQLEHGLSQEPSDPADFVFTGLSAKAHPTLVEQGRRGGPILALERVLQAQSMCIRLLIVLGEDQPEQVYTFDLVGAHPRTPARDLAACYTDLMNRMLTAVCTGEVTHHEILSDLIPQAVWRELTAPTALKQAGQELGRRKFFTDMVSVGALVDVPTLQGAIANQYSEGCYATFEPQLNALITTITGSARPVDKGCLTDDELAIITGLHPDQSGAIIQQVEGKRNDPPSSEAVEMMAMDQRLPRIRLSTEWGIAGEVPVGRSKLHGHRGVRSFDPQLVEHIHLEPAYYHYPVSCSTEAQAHAVQHAFAGSQALQNPDDPRQIVFAVLPGHGIVLVEKWVPGKAPLQALWEAMDSGALEVVSRTPQGPFTYQPDSSGKMILYEEE